MRRIATGAHARPQSFTRLRGTIRPEIEKSRPRGFLGPSKEPKSIQIEVMEGRRSTGWTKKRRAQQAKAIRRWKPWESSTGPCSEAGKERSSRNAYRGGIRQYLIALRAALRLEPWAVRELLEQAEPCNLKSETPINKPADATSSQKPQSVQSRKSRREIEKIEKNREHAPKAASPAGAAFRLYPLSADDVQAIKTLVGETLRNGGTPLKAALKAMNEAGRRGGPIAALPFASMCLPLVHHKVGRPTQTKPPDAKRWRF